MGAISSEIVHFLKVKLSLKMTRDGFSCILGFQNFSGEDLRNPLPDYKICDLKKLSDLFCQLNTAHTQAFCSSDFLLICN